jgi:hypothetical protein
MNDALSLLRQAIQALEQLTVDVPSPTQLEAFVPSVRQVLRTLHEADAVLTQIPLKDSCELCLGSQGGAPGNENVINGRCVCDSCCAQLDGLLTAETRAETLQAHHDALLQRYERLQATVAAQALQLTALRGCAHFTNTRAVGQDRVFVLTPAVAERLGATGAPHNEVERLLFEAYLQGHCWQCGDWNHKRQEYEDMWTRVAFALWRDRAALEQFAATDNCDNCQQCLSEVLIQGLPGTMHKMTICPQCGDKRCAAAKNHRNLCTKYPFSAAPSSSGDNQS